MKKDLRSNILLENALSYTSITATAAATANGATIDMQGYNSATFVLEGHTITDGTYTPAIWVGSSTATAGFTAAGSADLIGVASANALGSADDNAQNTLGYVGKERYLQLRVASSGITTGGAISAVVIKGHPNDAPATEG